MKTELHRSKLLKVLTSGKFVSVDFRKKNGDMRTITGRVGVGKHTNGKGMAFDPATRGLVVIWESTKSNRKDEKDKGYRMVKLVTVSKVRANKQTYTIVGY